MIDLAGSERAAQTKVSNPNLKQKFSYAGAGNFMLAGLDFLLYSKEATTVLFLESWQKDD